MNRYVEFGGVYTINGSKCFGRNIRVDVDKINESIRDKFNNTDIYSTTFSYDTIDQNDSDLIGPLYLDLDGDINSNESYNQVKQDTILAISYLTSVLKVPLEYIKIYFTGSKGFHIIVPHTVFGLTPSKDLNMKYKKIANDIKGYTLYKSIDIRIYDKKRLIRLPHSINGKTGLYKVPLIYQQLKLFDYSMMIHYATTDKDITFVKAEYIEKAKVAFDTITKEIKPNDVVRKEYKPNPNFQIPPCIKNIFRQGAEEGCRNNTAILLASSILQKGSSIEECADLLKNDWNTRNNPPMDETEIDITIKSAYSELMHGRKYGCQAAKELGACIGCKCKLYKQ